jgi:hypothetical protein
MRPKTKSQRPQPSFSDRKEVTMKSLRNRMLVIAAFAFAFVCASAIPVSAQVAYQGSFTLAHQVQWQNATLPAGDYTFELKSVANPPLIVLHGPNGSRLVTALVADEKPSERSMLLVQQRNGKSVVSDLYLAKIGLCLRYSVPKSREDAKLAQAPTTTERILVSVNAK